MTIAAAIRPGVLAMLVVAVTACTALDATQTGGIETLAPGAIVLADFTPRLAYTDTIDLMWTLHQADFARLDAPPKRAAAITVIRPQAVFDENGGVAPLPPDVGTWFTERPDLTIVSSEPIELGTASGILVEATVADAQTNRAGAIPIACTGPLARCHYQFDDPEAAQVLDVIHSEHLLILVATVGGDPIVVTAGTPPRTWDMDRADLDALLRSIRFPG